MAARGSVEGGRWRVDDPGWRGVAEGTDGTRGEESRMVPGARSKARSCAVTDRAALGPERALGSPELPSAPGKAGRRECRGPEQRVRERRVAVLRSSRSAGTQRLPALGVGMVSPHRSPETSGPQPSHFCRGSGNNWLGEPGAEASGLSLGVLLVLNPRGCLGVLTYLSQPGNSPLSALRPRGPVFGPRCGLGCMCGCLRKPLSPLPATRAGLQRGKCLGENRALPWSQKLGRDPPAPGTQLLKRR